MINDTIGVLSKVTESLAIGTNLGLLHFLWMLVSGALLPARGAVFPALKSIGLSDGGIRRAWGAFGTGKWQVSGLVKAWREYVEGHSGWTAHRINNGGCDGVLATELEGLSEP